MTEDKIEEDLAWLRQVIPPDDIYRFALSNYAAAEFFLSRLKKHVLLGDESMRDELLETWVNNLMYFRIAKERRLNIRWYLDDPNS